MEIPIERSSGYLYVNMNSNSITISNMRFFNKLEDVENYVRDDYKRYAENHRARNYRYSVEVYWYDRRIYEISSDTSPVLLPLEQRKEMIRDIV